MKLDLCVHKSHVQYIKQVAHAQEPMPRLQTKNKLC